MNNQQSLADFFYNLVNQYREKPMLSFMGTVYSYQTIYGFAEACAVYFQSSLQLKPGDRVAIMLPNIPQFAVVFWAAQLCGLITVALNPQYTHRELEIILKQARPRAMVVLDVQMPLVAPFAADMHMLVTKVGDLLPFYKALPIQIILACKGVIPIHTANVEFLNTVLASLKKQKIKRYSIDSQAIAMIQYTGGTTGDPKGVMLSHQNLLANIEQAYLAYTQLGITQGASQLLVLPMFHIYGLSVYINGCNQGALGILVANPKRTSQVIKIIKKYKPQIMPVINTLMVNLLNHPGFHAIKDFSWLLVTLSGGMATQKNTADQWQQVTGCVVNQGYGLSETSPIIAVTHFKQGDVFQEHVGRPVKDTSIKILNTAGQPVKVGQPGELFVKGPQVMQGYWKNLHETMLALDEGWFKTGDIVVQDEQGHLTIVDRSKDMVVISGFNVYPSEVEKVLQLHPAVIEAAVIGEVDANRQECLKAYCVTRYSLEPMDLIKHCKQLLAAYKVPSECICVHEIPKSQVGKVLKRKLKQVV